jgi:hypothetical protein
VPTHHAASPCPGHLRGSDRVTRSSGFRGFIGISQRGVPAPPFARVPRVSRAFGAFFFRGLLASAATYGVARISTKSRGRAAPEVCWNARACWIPV